MRKEMLDFLLNECIELRERILNEFVLNNDKVVSVIIDIQPDGGSFVAKVIACDENGEYEHYLGSLIHKEIEIPIPNRVKAVNK